LGHLSVTLVAALFLRLLYQLFDPRQSPAIILSATVHSRLTTICCRSRGLDAEDIGQPSGGQQHEQNNPVNRRIVLNARPVGAPTVENFRLEECDVPIASPGQVLTRTLYLSLDPYMRGRMSDAPSYTAPLALGEVMVGGTVGIVAASQHPDYQPATWCAATAAGRTMPSAARALTSPGSIPG
jgi:hypothetical protein